MCSDGCWCRVALGVVLLFGVASCSVKEDRSACPAALTLVMEGLPSYPVLLSVSGTEGYSCQLSIPRDTVVLLRPPGGAVRIRAVAGATPQPDGRVQVPYGFDCPPVYLYSARCTLRDTATVQLRMHRHFCALSLEMDGPPGWGEPFWAQVQGGVEGLEPDGTPLPGAFACRLDAGMACRLPRQAPDEALWLDVIMPEGGGLRRFALGNYLLKAGYDWAAPDLAPLSLTLSLAVTQLIVRSPDWTVVVPMEIII